MTLNLSIASTPQSIKEATATVVDAVNQRSTLSIVTQDPAGTNHYTNGQPITVSDTTNGDLFVGFIDQGDESNLYPQTQINTTISGKDNHYLADKKRVDRDRQNMAAGDIAVSLVANCLAVEGVTAGYALRHDELLTDWQAGTLGGVSATTNAGDGNPGDGDLELTPIGSTVTHTDQLSADFASGTLTNMDAGVSGQPANQINLHAYNVLKFTAICQYSQTTDYVSWKFWSGSQAIASGDYLQYDVWISSTSPEIKAAVDMIMTDGNKMRDYSNQAVRDQFSIHAHPASDLKGFADDQWYTRRLTLTPLAGKTISYASLAFGGQSAGNYQAYFRNVKIYSSGGTLKLALYDSNANPYNPGFSPPNASSPLTNLGYSNVTLVPITAYDQVGTRISSAISIDAPKVVNTSLVTWTSLIPTSVTPASQIANSAAPLVPDGTSIAIATSIDNNETYQACSFRQSIPNLLAGLWIGGHFLYTRIVLAISGTTPEISPIVTSLTATITSSYTRANHDMIKTWSTPTDFNTGTYTNTVTQALGTDDGDVTLNEFADNFDGHTTFNTGGDNTTLYGGASPGAVNVQRQLQLTSGNAADVRLRMQATYSAPFAQLQDATWQVDVTVLTDASGVNSAMGLCYRTTYFDNQNNTFAYTAYLSTNGVYFAKGSNNGTPAYTQLAYAAATFTAGQSYTLKVVASGNNHQIFVDDVLYINQNDATYVQVGWTAIRMYNNTGATVSGLFDNYGIASSLTGTWLSAAQGTSGVGTIGASIIFWDADVPTGCTLLCETTITGGVSWATATNGAAIPQINVGDPAPTAVQVRFTFTTPSATIQPVLRGVTIWLANPMTATGNRISPVLSLTPVGRAGSTFINWTANNALTAEYVDTFAGRTDFGTLGNASDGNLWFTTDAFKIFYSVNGNEGSAYYDNTGGGFGRLAATLGGNTLLTDVNVLCRFNFLAATGSPLFHVFFRYVDASNYYGAQLALNGTLTLYKLVAGVQTTLGTATITGVAAAENLWLQGQVQGTTLLARAWTDGITPPTSWNLSATDSAFAGPGSVGLGLTVMGTTALTGINFDSFTASQVNLGVDVSPNGSTWTDVSGYNGVALPTSYIYTQPDPYLDFFPIDSHTKYTQTAFGGGGGGGTWTWDTTNKRLVAVGASNDFLRYDGFTRKDSYIEATLNYADNAGLIVRAVDSSNCYLLYIHDGSSSFPNTMSLYKVVANVQTQIGTYNSLSFARGDYHIFRLDAQGSTISVLVDGVSRISVTDSAITGAGKCGLQAGVKGQFYSVRVQPYGDSVVSANLYTRVRESTVVPTITPQVLDLTVSVRDPNIQTGALISTTNYAAPGKNLFSCAQAFDDLAKQSSTIPTQGTVPQPFLWYLGKDKRFHFHAQSAVPAPFYLYSGKAGSANSSGNILWAIPPRVTRPNMLYRNRHTVDGGIDTTTLVHEQRVGDGLTQAWPMRWPLASVPYIVQTNPAVSLVGVTSTVGVQGVDTGKDFYWQSGNNIISQDGSETPPSKTDVIDFYYYGQIPVRVTANNTGQFPGTVSQAQMAAIATGTSGIVEDYEAVANLSKAGATALCNSRLQQFGVLGLNIVIATRVFGIMPGQLLLLSLPEHGIVNTPFVATKVTTTGRSAAVPGNVYYEYVIEATTGSTLQDYAIFYGRMLQGTTL